MADILIKEHKRKTKKGTIVSVKGYTRRVGFKGRYSPKKSSSANPGDEFISRVAKDDVGITTGPIVKDRYVPKEERDRILKEESKRGYNRYADYGDSGRSKGKEKGAPSSERKKILEEERKVNKSDSFKRVENSIAKFVEKYGGKYKRKL